MSNVLLDTGTGEVEIVEFMVDNQSYGINVLKIKSIIKVDKITLLPQMREEILGLTNVRGSMNTVIDLSMVLHNKKTENYSNSLGLLCELNGKIVVFLVEKVKGIRRVLWQDIKQVSDSERNSLSIGSILIDDSIIVLLDFESITIAAGIGNGYESQAELSNIDNDTGKKAKVVVVEDSKAIGEMIKCTLLESGYSNIKLFSNGVEAKEYIFGIKKKLGINFNEEIDVIITDIEMPIMDGYTLTKSIKEDDILKKIPVIIFSSLITDELKHKGEAVGADIQIGKPSMKELVDVINKLFNESRKN